jgi:hypothetical protein
VDVPFGLSPWSHLWSRGVGFCLVLVCMGKTDKDLWIRRGRFQLGTRRAISVPKSEDPDREVTQPLGGIGGLHQVVSELIVLHL